MKKLKTKTLAFLLVVCSQLIIKGQVLTSTSTICNGIIAPFGGVPTSNVVCPIPSSNDWLNKYSQQSTYIPNNNSPLITLKITLHIFTKSDGTAAPGLWENNASAVGSPAVLNSFYLNTITNSNGDRFSTPRSATYPAAFSIPLNNINDSKIRYEVTNIYYYPSDVLYPWPTNTLTYYNDASTHLNYIQTTYPGRLEEGLPILIANTGWGFASGFNGAPFVATSISYYDSDFFRKHLLHEIGHCFGLYHTYFKSCCPDDLSCTNIDYLSDVFPDGRTICPATDIFGNPAPYIPTNSCQSCYELADDNFNETSNNIMAGQASNWISPLQMGRRIRNMRLPGTGIRQFAKDVPSDHVNTWDINANEIWDFDIQMYEDIVVKTGNTLTVKCKIAMAQGGKIIVEKGAKLVIDGGEVTTWSKQGLWTGIEIDGTYNQPQNFSGGYGVYQGYVNIINGGTISNANVGVKNALTNPTTGGYILGSGGIVIANNANFINNREDVEMLYYQSPNGGNVSSFSNCNFKVNNTLVNGVLPLYRALLVQVEGVKFFGCNFENSFNGYGKSGYGLYSVNANFAVDQTNASAQTKVKGFDHGVYVNNTNPLKVPSIKNTVFTNNSINAAYLNNCNTPIFESNTVTTPGLGGSCGLYLNNCKYYNAKNNTFLQNYSGTAGGDIGLYVNNSQAGAHSIYRNSFANLAVGIGAMNNNSGSTTSIDGLKMNCNDFTAQANAYDIALMNGTSSPLPTVMTNQGVVTGDPKDLVRNKYAASSFCTTCENQWYVQGTSAKSYNHGANSNINTRPSPQPNLSDVSVNIVNSGIPLLPAHCPTTNITPNPGCPCTGCCRLAEINSALSAAQLVTNTTISFYNSKLDGGNTQTLLNSIYDNTSNGNLKNMLAAAPFLSDTVLKTYFSKNGTPNGHIKDIHGLNAPVTEPVWQILVGLNLPNGIINQITATQNATKISNRSIAQAQINLAKFNLQDVANQKLNYFLTDSLPASKDSVIQVLETNVGQLQDTKMLLVFANLNKGDIVAAEKANLDLQSTQPALADYISQLIRLEMGPDKYFSLNTNPDAVHFFTDYAINTENIGYGGAQALLEFATGATFDIPRLMPEQNSGARLLNNITKTSELVNTVETNDFKVYPNPTNNVINFMCKATTECTHITLATALGTVVYTADVKPNHANEINLINFNTGIYLLTAYNDKLKVYQTKIIYIK
jgi:hypothetical protein